MACFILVAGDKTHQQQEGERERERQTDRETEKQRDRETERQRDREREKLCTKIKVTEKVCNQNFYYGFKCYHENSYYKVLEAHTTRFYTLKEPRS